MSNLDVVLANNPTRLKAFQTYLIAYNRAVCMTDRRMGKTTAVVLTALAESLETPVLIIAPAPLVQNMDTLLTSMRWGGERNLHNIIVSSRVPRGARFLSVIIDEAQHVPSDVLAEVAFMNPPSLRIAKTHLGSNAILDELLSRSPAHMKVHYTMEEVRAMEHGGLSNKRFKRMLRGG